MREETPLPAGFEELERFAAAWALPSEGARNRFRVARTMAEIDDFCSAVFPRLDDICDHVDRYPLEAMPLPAARLLQLALMFMEASPAFEVYRQPDVPNAIAHDRLRIVTPDDPIKVV